MIKRWMLVFSLAAMPLVFGGCALGLLAYKLQNTKVSAQYAPGEKTRILVLVDRNPQVALGQEVLDRLAILIDAELNENKVGQLISSTAAMEIRSRAPEEFADLRPARIGAEVGAQQVIHVTVTEFETNTVIGGKSGQNITAAVRVIDAAADRRLWPGQEDQMLIHMGGRRELAALMDPLARGISQLFYDHYPDDPDPDSATR